MSRSRWFIGVAVGLLLHAQADPARAAIIAGQVDTFEDGTTQSWTNGGSMNPEPAANISAGGPAGADDNYLRVTSNGGFSAGGKLVVFNLNQWAGDYIAAGVDALRMQVNNLGATDLTLRLILSNAFSGGTLSTVADVDVPTGGGWTTVLFSLDPANLTGGDYDAVMSGVTELALVHSPSLIASRSSAPNIVAHLGVDNITAAVVPEPGAVGAAAVAIAAARRLGRSAVRSSNVDLFARKPAERESQP